MGILCQHCGKSSTRLDRVGWWTSFNNGYLCRECWKKYLNRYKKVNETLAFICKECGCVSEKEGFQEGVCDWCMISEKEEMWKELKNVS